MMDCFHPAVRGWFEESFGAPTPPQERGWPAIQRGEHVLIAAPTGSGKTLAAFLWALDGLFREGPWLASETRVLYVSPLRALSHDVQRNLERPLAAISARDPFLPEIRVMVRTGDTPSGARAAMVKAPPHVLVTTPESLYILLTSESGRRLLRTVRTTIVDEIHALIGSKRGAHLALSLERLEALAGPFQRIGLSATQKPLDAVGRFLTGVDRPCTLVDEGHQRELDLAVEIPGSPLETVCSHETWAEIHERIAALVENHRTTLVFVNTRKLAERLAARLTEILGPDAISSHHGSLSRELRLEAESRLKEGRLRALVATASLELGIDVGEVDLAVQVGVPASIATFLQRVGRAGHALGRIPKGRIFPLTRDELVAATALVRAVRAGRLDVTPQPTAPLDVLAQQTVASAVAEETSSAALLATWKRAWPYRDLDALAFDRVVGLHLGGRSALLHADGVGHRLLPTKRARLQAITGGGTIPDKGEFRVIVEPDGTLVGTLDEDFAIESTAGDVIQLGNAAWRILRVHGGTVRVADAAGMPASLPFWLGEGPSRTKELSLEVAAVRELAAGSDGADLLAGSLRDRACVAAPGSFTLPDAAAIQLRDYVRAGVRALGALPTQDCVVLERFFDDSGGMQLVLHAPFGGRINRAWGLALRKRFCRGFGFELQAAATEDSVLLSLGPHHSFPLEEVFDYLHPNTVRHVLTQAVLASPMFTARWRWNVVAALKLPRREGGRRVPAALQRMKAEDLLAEAFPDVLACGENLPGGDLTVPMDHPLVAQTVTDCLTEAMDIEGLVQVLERLRAGSLLRVAVDTPEPSPFAHAVLDSQPYTFLDDAPLEERRARAVTVRRGLDVRTVEALGSLDADAVARVREEAWPRPESREEVHEVLSWMGYVTDEEAAAWQPWVDSLRSAGRILARDGQYRAVEFPESVEALLLGRLEACGPVVLADEAIAASSPVPTVPAEWREAMGVLERSGRVLRTRLAGVTAWCDRRLLARIHRYTVEGLRARSRPVSLAAYLRFLSTWQHATEESRVEGPNGILEIIGQLAGFAIPAHAWEHDVFARRCRDYRHEWLDRVTLNGDVAWGRLFGSAGTAVRTTPLSLWPREDLEAWLGLADFVEDASVMSPVALAISTLLRERGALFAADLERRIAAPREAVDEALGELIARGCVTSDSFDGLRRLLAPQSQRSLTRRFAGRWALLRTDGERREPPSAAFLARQFLRRYGVVFRRVLLRERTAVPWRDLARELRLLELKGEVLGGRFVEGPSGEQFALPRAVPLLRDARAEGPLPEVPPHDPMHLRLFELEPLSASREPAVPS